MKPKTEPWMKLPRSLIASKAWQSMTINERRLIDFLMLEHMRHAGQRNGDLVAPRHQLEQFGIGARHISAAIDGCSTRGLIDMKRGKGRSPNRYALTWLQLHDKTEPSNRWRGHGNGTQVLNNDFRREAPRVSEGKSQRPVATSEGKSQRHISRVSEGKHPSRIDLTKETGTKDSIYGSAASATGPVLAMVRGLR